MEAEKKKEKKVAESKRKSVVEWEAFKNEIEEKQKVLEDIPFKNSEGEIEEGGSYCCGKKYKETMFINCAAKGTLNFVL